MNSINRLKIRQLEIFVEVARQKSVNRAAAVLNLSQPAVTRTLRELEEICGKQLVEKDGRGIRISHYGSVFLRHAGASIAAARDGLRALAQESGADGPPLRIGALPTVSATLIPLAVSRFLASDMGNTLQIVSGDNRVLLSQLRKGELDLVVGRLPAPELMQGLEFEPLYREKVVFIVDAAHPLAGCEQISIRDLDGFPVLVPIEGSIIRPLVNRLFIEQGLTAPRQVIETVSESFGRAFVKRNNAIWIISRGVVSAEVESGEFFPLPIDTDSTLGSVGLNIRAGCELDHAVHYFAGILRELARASRAE
jgi:LysR family pca operon transcriptional activator